MPIRSLHEQAQRCWRLAKSIYNPSATEALEAYARQLETEAEQLERGSTAEQPRSAGDIGPGSQP